MRLPGLPRALDGFTIVQLSDIHVGPSSSAASWTSWCAQSTRCKPDLVAITGDLVDGSVRELGARGGRAAQPAARATARTSSPATTSTTRGRGVGGGAASAWASTVLRNRHVRIGDAGGLVRPGGRGRLGRAAPGQQGYDLDAGARRAGTRSAPRCCSRTSPPTGAWRRRRAWACSSPATPTAGSSSPSPWSVSAIWEHAAGHFQHGDRHLYVSRGTGFWGPPMRVGSPPELVKLVLTS